MYSTSGAPRRPPRGGTANTGAFLARPRLGTVRGVYSSKPFTKSTYGAGSLGLGDKHRRTKYKKPTSTQKMDGYKKRPDPVDTAYREAVGRLKVLLAESYTPMKRSGREDSGDDTDNQSLMSSRSRHSHHHYHRSTAFMNRRYPFYTAPLKPSYSQAHAHSNANAAEPDRKEEDKATPEMMTFIDRQEEYIEQLEREAQFCREELSGLLGKVKEVISENENLQEKQKSHLIKSVFEQLETETETEPEPEPRRSPARGRRLEGPSIVFESRISELEAQLTQKNMELRKCQDENDNYRKRLGEGAAGAEGEGLRAQLDGLQRERAGLRDSVARLQAELAQVRERSHDSSHQIQRSLDVVEQAHFEKAQLESEVRRLKDELERQHDKLRDAAHEQARRLADERAAAERRYSQQLEQLTSELGVQWEAASRLQLELDKQRREDSDVRRDALQKQAHIDDLRKEIHAKTAALQSDLATSAAEKSALEQQVATLNLAVERAERQAKQEAARLQAEIQSLRQRLDRADADLLHSRRENLRLSDQVASLEKELSINALLAEDRARKQATGQASAGPAEPTPPALPALPALPVLPAPAAKDRETELSSMIKDMEAKHVSTVAELEAMINSQNQLMEKLTGECHLLTQKLEDASNRHKEEIRELQVNLDFLNSRLSESKKFEPSNKDEQHNLDNDQRTATHSTDTTKQLNPTETVTDAPVNKAPLSRTNSNSSMKNSSGTDQTDVTKPNLSQPPPQEVASDSKDTEKGKEKGNEKENPEYENQKYDENQYEPGYENYENYSGEQPEYTPGYEGGQQYEGEQPYPADQQYSEQYQEQQYEGQYPADQQYQGDYPGEQYNQQYPEQYEENPKYEQYQEETKQ